MEWNEYQQLALKTESLPLNGIIRQDFIRDFHGLMGLVTEVGELLDSYKRCIFYGKELDKVNVEEEVGDILWYLAIFCDASAINLSSVMERNIAKLKARYPNRFRSEDALNRDLEAERKVLET